MRRALLLSPTSVQGGAERALTALARGLPAHGYEPVAVLLEPGPLEDWLRQVGCPVEVLPAGRTRQLHRTTQAITRISHRAAEAHVVLSNQSKGHVYGALAGRLARRPVVRWQHGVPTLSRIELAAAAVGAAAIVCNTAAASAAQRRLTPRSRIERIPPGLNISDVQGRRGSGRAIRDRFRGAPLIGVVGRIEPSKGQDVFLRAAAQLARRHPDAMFLVVGGAVLGWQGDEGRRLEGLAADLGIRERVCFAGHQDDVYPWIDAMDVVVHASFGDSFGLVLVEAMALGRPLVATVSSGPLEIVQDGTSGLLVPPGDPDAMADAIARILTSPELRVVLESGGPRRAAFFDEEPMVTSFAALFDGLVDDYKVRRRVTRRRLGER